MERGVLLLLSFGLISTLLSGCGNKTKSPLDEVDTGKTEEWQTAYEAFLDDLYTNNNNDDGLEFLVKDLDNSGIPELIVAENGTTISVYVFDGTVEKAGNSVDFGGTIRYLYCDNPSYPGIIYFYVSGGLELYGYMTI